MPIPDGNIAYINIIQLSAAHEKEHFDKAIAAFAKVGKALGVIKA